MTLYSKPWYYTLFHMVMGFAAVWYPFLAVCMFLWQFGQYVFNVRVFAMEQTIRPGNSLEYTLLKLAEIGVGYIAGLLVLNICKNGGCSVNIE